jgi:hypothetical protein
VRPAADEHHALVVVADRAALQQVIDAARIALQQPAEAREHRGHGHLGVLRRVAKEHVILVGHDHEEMTLPTRLLELLGVGFWLDRSAGGIGGQHLAGDQRVEAHGLHHRGTERVAHLLHVPAHGAPVQALALRLQVLLEPVVGHAQRELLHGEEGQGGGVQQTARDQELGHLGREHRRLPTNRDLVLEHALDQHPPAARLVHQLVAVVVTDDLALGCQLRIGNIDHDLGERRRRQIAAPFGLRARGRRPGWFRRRGGLVFGSGEVVELLLQGLLLVEEIAQGELQFAGAAALALGAEEAAFEQGVLAAEGNQAPLQRLDLSLQREQGGLQRGDDLILLGQLALERGDVGGDRFRHHACVLSWTSGCTKNSDLRTIFLAQEVSA